MLKQYRSRSIRAKKYSRSVTIIAFSPSGKHTSSNSVGIAIPSVKKQPHRLYTGKYIFTLRINSLMKRKAHGMLYPFFHKGIDTIQQGYKCTITVQPPAALH
ncbi:MAG: hypothetical protein ACMZI0_09790 [Symbiopectobacterium sp.]|uniref:hypothetical protein n=1 Tax=Symbiopectobacterium sp. TaxID=2952789 RepID=UPI0039ED968F